MSVFEATGLQVIVQPAMTIVLIAHNIRSSHNIGSLLRTAEGLGITRIYLTGYSPHPKSVRDKRLPHLAEKQTKQIAKTALGAESLVAWRYQKDITVIIARLKEAGFIIAALEQTPGSIEINGFSVPAKTALIVGNETGGLDGEILALADIKIHLPMAGRKESFNVAVAAGMALYHLKLKGDGQID
jgi:23S rRNA (guanosine2251-2'-O)-methyltransferase